MEHCVAKEASPHRARLGAYDLTAKFGPLAVSLLSARLSESGHATSDPIADIGGLGISARLLRLVRWA